MVLRRCPPASTAFFLNLQNTPHGFGVQPLLRFGASRIIEET